MVAYINDGVDDGFANSAGSNTDIAMARALRIASILETELSAEFGDIGIIAYSAGQLYRDGGITTFIGSDPDDNLKYVEIRFRNQPISIEDLVP